MAESKIRTEAKKLSVRLAGNPKLIEEFKAGFSEGIEEGINKQIDSLVKQQEQLTKFMDSIKILSSKPKETTPPLKTKPKTPKKRQAGEQETRLRANLKDPDTLTKVVKRLYGLADVNGDVPETMWFKTTDLIRKVWLECFDKKLVSTSVAQNIARYIGPTLLELEKTGKAKRKGFAKHTRWLLFQ